LQDWPAYAKASAGKPIIEEMEKVRQIVELGLSSRAKSGIKIRQPLGLARISGDSVSEEYIELIKDELNVKQVKFVKGENKVELDTKITPELQTEGNLRELVRSINSLRKKQGLTPGDVVTISYSTSSKELGKVFDAFGDELKKSVIASELVEKENGGESIDINSEQIKISIQK
jgi:isoleucyl-tRNA synthetase